MINWFPTSHHCPSPFNVSYRSCTRQRQHFGRRTHGTSGGVERRVLVGYLRFLNVDHLRDGAQFLLSTGTPPTFRGGRQDGGALSATANALACANAYAIVEANAFTEANGDPIARVAARPAPPRTIRLTTTQRQKLTRPHTAHAQSKRRRCRKLSLGHLRSYNRWAGRRPFERSAGMRSCRSVARLLARLGLSILG